MRKLKCTDCGGQVKISTSPEGLVLGQCAHCQSEFLLELKGRQHVIIEHRYAAPAPVQTLAAKPSRRLVLGATALLGGAALMSLFPSLVDRKAARAPKAAKLLFNVGGEGASPGQFRDQVYEMGIDSLSRAVLIDNRNRIYVFGPEGNFLRNYAQPDGVSRKFCALLPSGDLIFATSDSLTRHVLESGQIIETVAVADARLGWGSLHCVTPDGGFAVYSQTDHSAAFHSSQISDDMIVFFGPDLRETHRLTGLLTQAIVADAMATAPPTPTSIAVDAAGSVFINARPQEDHDPRGGIFEFNARGTFQRRIAVEQQWHGTIAVGQGNTLWYADPWMNVLQQITATAIRQLPLTGLDDTSGQSLGNVASFALYPNGDLGVTTMNHRFLRLSALDPQ